VIDEGASFIHGTHGNPIAEMFSAAMTYSPDPDGYSMYDEQGRAVEPGVDKSVQQEFNQMLDMLDWLRERNGVQAADHSDDRTKRRRGGHLKRQVSAEERTGPASPQSEEKRALKRKTFSEIPDTTNWSLEQGIKYYLDSTHKSSSVLRQLYTAVLQDRPRTNGAAQNNKMTGSEDLRRQVFMWHVANIEAPCSSPVANLSLHHWDQDDPYVA
jgi:lysine-specific histone demethylase 1